MTSGASSPPQELRSTPKPPRGLIGCATCGAAVDPLRAARVRVLAERFRYFCSESCAADFDITRLTPLPQPRRRRPNDGAQVIATVRASEEGLASRRQLARELDSVIHDDGLDPSLELPVEETPLVADPELPATEPERAQGSADVGGLLLSLAMLGGALSVALMLAGGSEAALVSRLVVLTVGCGALVAQNLMGERDRGDPSPVAMLAAPLLATAIAILARILGLEGVRSATTLAGAIVFILALLTSLVRRARQPVDAEREHIATQLEAMGRRVVGEEVKPVRALDLRPGEEIVVESGEVVPVDGTVTAGSGRLEPWLGAKSVAEYAEGDTVVAGARVVSGRIRVVVGWAADDRTWMRLTNDPRRRADLLGALPRAGRLIAERAAPLAAGLGALSAFAANLDLLQIALLGLAGQASIANPAVAHLAALNVGRGVLRGLRRGVAFRTAEAFDATGRVTLATFCARGTLLLGEPEVANVEPVGDHDAGQVVALIAGAESGASHPVATAVLRAARARGVRPDGTRSHNFQPGLGISAVASSGQRLVVGSRALMLQEKVSVASAEAQINELEALGRSVLLVALGGRLVGVVGLQDGLRPGARAAVQLLLDVGVEPVLLSGDARETCETLGRALDIEHVRPEVLPPDRGEEIRRMSDGGVSVAVIGKSPIDDQALSASDVSVALCSAGATTSEWSVQLASDDVRDAAYAIRLAHDTRRDARSALVVSVAPAAAGALATAFALVPAVVAPLAAALGAVAGLYLFRSHDEA